MDQEVVRRRNAVFLVIYRKTTRIYPACVPRAVRWLFEALFLIMAIGTLCLWGYVHFTYIVEPDDCLKDITERPFPYDEILQVEVYTNSTELWSKRQALLLELSASLTHYRSDKNLTSDTLSEEEIDADLANGWFFWLFSGVPFEEEEEGRQDDGNGTDGVNVRDTEDMEKDVDVSIMEHHSLYEIFDVYTLKHHSIDYTILEFSQEPGYLSLTQSARTRLNITTRKLYINPENSTCFGGSFGQFITKYFIGYDMMIIGSFKNLLPLVQGSGYVKNLLNANHYYYRVQWMGKWRYVAGLLPALFFTLVASVLLRQIHYHVFKFLTHFHHLLNEGVPMPVQTGAQIPFLIITYAAIGLIIVMSEALGDDSLFSLLMVATVWEADQFFAVFCRHHISKTFFPMFFFLYHFIPYAYYIRFNGQFWFIPFIFHWFLLQHAILLFFHHYELNAEHHGRVQPLIVLAAEVHHHQRGHPPRRDLHAPEEPPLLPQPQVQAAPPFQDLSDTEGSEVRQRRRPRPATDSVRTASPRVREQHISSPVQASAHRPEASTNAQDDLELSVEESSQGEVHRDLCVIGNTTLTQALHSEPPDSQQPFSQALCHSGMASRRDLHQSTQPDREHLRRKRLLYLDEKGT